MKAVVCTKYGPPEVLQIREVEKPVPRDREILIKVHASTVTTGDCRIRSFTFARWFWLAGRLLYGLTGPRRKIPGCDFAGEIEAVGKDANACMRRGW
jgi:NADPH:quinone reductase-like Zn-dependent oxidoreductase